MAHYSLGIDWAALGEASCWRQARQSIKHADAESLRYSSVSHTISLSLFLFGALNPYYGTLQPLFTNLGQLTEHDPTHVYVYNPGSLVSSLVVGMCHPGGPLNAGSTLLD